MSLYLVESTAGDRRDLAKDVRQQAHWDDHAAFIDALVDEEFIVLGGPFPDEGGAMLVVRAESEAEARSRLETDPWYVHGILKLVSIHRWEIFIDRLHPVAR